MKEYFGKAAKKYGQPQDKYFTLFPALETIIPIATSGQSAIDLGCGTGVLWDLVTRKGYSYLGVDISEDMLEQARVNNPQGIYVQGDATQPLSEIDQTFDMVISNMLSPSISTIRGFRGLFEVAYSLLKKNGLFILSTGHPCFDGYMQKHFFHRKDIETNFKGYFTSGTNYQVHRALEQASFTFSDYHWTLSDYYFAAKAAHLSIEDINECPVVGDAPLAVQEKFQKKGAPSYIVFVIKK